MGFKLLAAAALATMAAAATPAYAVNLVTNGSFEADAIGAGTKPNFAGNVTGWSGGGGLSYLASPGTATTVYLDVYGPFPATSPDGGNFIEQDGDPSYRSAFFQTINGLTVGASYTLTFYQAAGQQAGFTGPTTERWEVSFGAQTQLSSQFSLPQGGVGAWEAVSMTFTASAVSQVLSFVAQGTPAGQPPISFLDGVSLQASVPEPLSLSLLGVGVVGTGLARRRAKRAA